VSSILAQLGALLTKKMSHKAEHMRGLQQVLADMPVPAVSKPRSSWFNVHQVCTAGCSGMLLHARVAYRRACEGSTASRRAFCNGLIHPLRH
jgi:hypothetical protein